MELDPAALDLLTDPVFVLDNTGHVVHANRAARRVFEVARSATLATTLGLSPRDCDSALVAAAGTSGPVECALDGGGDDAPRMPWTNAHVVAMRGADRQLQGFAVRVQNSGAEEFRRLSTDLRRANRELFEQRRLRNELEATQRRLDAVLRAMPAAEFDCDADGVVLTCNPAASRMLDIPTQDIVGERIGKWVRVDPRVHFAFTGERGAPEGDVPSLVNTGHPLYCSVRRGGGAFPGRIHIGTFDDAEDTGGGFVALVTDLSEIAARQTELRLLAHTDPLTQALNRRRFLELAEAEHARCMRYQRQAMVVMFDLDHFKSINDTWGHDAGDRVLVAFAKMVQAMRRKSDVLGRWGGEEFVILLPEADEVAAEAFANRVLDALRLLRVEVADGERVALTASAGVAPLLVPDGTMEDALRLADVALYEAKADGRDRVVVAPDSASATLELPDEGPRA